MAIARRLGPEIEPLFFTLSAAAAVVSELGFPVEYMASHTSPGVGNDWRWERRLGPRLEAAIAEAEPRVVVFDGILPWEPLLKAIRPVPLTVWCRRGLWRPGASALPLRRAGRFDAVLEPGELAAGEDRGPSAGLDGAHRVPPIVFCDDAELLPRAEAERELGLREGQTNVVVQLGQGPEVAGVAERSLRALAGREGVQVAALSSLIEGLPEVPEGIVHLRATFPMSRYYAAFDGAVSAAGYNSFHELIRFGVPSVFVPMPRETDDQAARSGHAQAPGVGIGVEGPDDPSLERGLEALLDPERRGAMRERLGELRPPNGAVEAASWLERLVGESSAGGERGGGRDGDGRRAVGGARPAPAPRLRDGATWLASVPRTVARLGGQVISRPRPRTLVVALGVEGEELERRLGEALAELADPPSRVLVVTDSLRIGPLRALGLGVEHVPAAGGRQPELAGGDYGSFLRRRLGLILAQRPRLRRAIAIGEVPPELLDAATAPPRRRARLLR
jgi:hypothetical protein